jgi:hypothetical protein
MKYYFGALAVVVFFACQLEETNINPNDPTDAPVQVLLPPAQQRLANFWAGDAAVISGIFANYFVGFDGLVRPLEVYEVDNNFFMRPIWEDMYVSVLPTLKTIIEKSDAADSPHYAGVARVLYAYAWGTTSSLWGEIPFSQALQGPEILQPAYDGQQSVYQGVQDILDQAIADLSEPQSLLAPAQDDLFFAGNITAWKRVAHTLKARFYLHTVKRDPGAAGKALAALAEGIASPAGSLAYPYGNQEFNPWFRYQQTTPNIRVDLYFRNLLTGDPRRNFMIRTTFGESVIGEGVAGQFASLPMATYHESKFLEAEALLRTDGAGAQEALNEAVSAHIRFVSGNAVADTLIAAYLQNKCVLSGAKDQDLETVLTQKYIAMYATPEGWTDFRRSGYPELTPNPDGSNPNNPNGEIPRRFPYPLTEILYNANTPSPPPNLQERMWWDEN